MDVEKEQIKLDDKVEAVKEVLKRLNNFVVAFSGGVDSTLLAVLAKEAVSKQNFVAVTAVSPVFPEFETMKAKNLAGEIDINHIEISPKLLKEYTFIENPPNRCYYCKKIMAEEFTKTAKDYGYNYVLDGTNHEEFKTDYRPGIKAAREKGLKSPLKTAGFSKEDIRNLARVKGISNWSEPSNACLATRIPYGDNITAEKLSMVEKAEELIRELGILQLRVRHHGNIARIEVSPGEIELLVSNRERIAVGLKELGFNYITLDLLGYKEGSLNMVKNFSG